MGSAASGLDSAIQIMQQNFLTATHQTRSTKDTTCKMLIEDKCTGNLQCWQQLTDVCSCIVESHKCNLQKPRFQVVLVNYLNQVFASGLYKLGS